MIDAKSDTAFRTIGEVAEELGVQNHVLRFWESKFTQIKPLKRAGGRRYYRPEDVALISRIHQLLYRDGYTIKGVQQLLKNTSKKEILEQKLDQGLSAPVLSHDEYTSSLRAVLQELLEMREQVRALI